jgi:hypothetical protein
MELLGIRVQRNLCSLGGGSTRKEVLWREYIYRSCLNGCVVRVWCLRDPLGNVAVWARRLVGRLSRRFGAGCGLCQAVASGGGRFVGVFFILRGCEVECAGNGRGGGISI